MQITTSTGTILECESITSIPSPPRLYLHLTGISTEDATSIFDTPGNLPVNGYPAYTEVQSVSQEGAARVKVSLKIKGT